ncbi:MAG TPA: hypothetical protein G4O03_07255 [Dehalococcoidia bacterium]|nr:hypothetical protein [Dehalococcoidia bacterium]
MNEAREREITRDEALFLFQETRNWHRALKLFAMHDVNLACRFWDKIALLKKGHVFAVGEPASVITDANLRDVYGISAVVNKDSGQP